MILALPSTWPTSLLEYLASKREELLAYARHERETMDAYLAQDDGHVPMAMMPANPYLSARDEATETVLDHLQTESLRGWHCSRLTDHEMSHIAACGMQPPNPQILQRRIERLQVEGSLAGRTADLLLRKNQADDGYRKGMIWFCFFEPRSAGQHGIERFFRRWGGEALYNSHEDDPHTGEALRGIGRPCLVEADVPISLFGRVTFLADKVTRRYLLEHGFDTGESWEHEDKARGPIPATNIVRFIVHGDPEFPALTGCDTWEPPLT
jgi:hypothetical protein